MRPAAPARTKSVTTIERRILAALTLATLLTIGYIFTL